MITRFAPSLSKGRALTALAVGLALPLHGEIKMAPASPSSEPAAPQMMDIAAPIDVFPYPPWMVALAIILLLLILGVIAWWVVRKIRNRPPPIPPTAREIALKELAALRPQIDQLEPYRFSISVSDVLRRFVSGHFGLKATQQTSPEFLGSLSTIAQISAEDRALLAQFLERCDMIKFARVEASTNDSQGLLSSAFNFVQGERK